MEKGEYAVEFPEAVKQTIICLDPETGEIIDIKDRKKNKKYICYPDYTHGKTGELIRYAQEGEFCTVHKGTPFEYEAHVYMQKSNNIITEVVYTNITAGRIYRYTRRENSKDRFTTLQELWDNKKIRRVDHTPGGDKDDYDQFNWPRNGCPYQVNRWIGLLNIAKTYGKHNLCFYTNNFSLLEFNHINKDKHDNRGSNIETTIPRINSLHKEFLSDMVKVKVYSEWKNQKSKSLRLKIYANEIVNAIQLLAKGYTPPQATITNHERNRYKAISRFIDGAGLEGSLHFTPNMVTTIMKIIFNFENPNTFDLTEELIKREFK